MAALMGVEERAETLRSTAEELVGEDELLPLLHGNPSPVCLDSFEPSVSGRVHIWQGVGKVINVNKMVRAGCRVKILIADQRTGLKDLSEIRAAGRRAIEVWKALGMSSDGMDFLWCSEETSRRAHEYWPLVMGISRNHSVRWLASLHADPDNVAGNQLLEPIMKCADTLFLEADICQMGMDQREVSMMARGYCEHIGRANKPIFLLHHVLPGFKEGQQRMSEKDPLSAIFMEDTESEVTKKIKKAFCPPKITQGNPCLEYVEHIVLPWFREFEVVPPDGGNRTYVGIEELREDYGSGTLHPRDLKPALAKAINQILQLVRDHFEKNCEAKGPCDDVK
ncbi:tyrosine--tRNA ligase 1, cytoplasmic-like [Triticum dicoccoides]|uniref:tyrosine--tRNA ligase 1, cytoplasmic-like n=1 Tax=Triticum dicoccoides TaxID=85692 RepID=UPI001890EAD8|nr:tyrosine--tRNA ligase 1, cytoplasmic-like [Triticum dicoccoides]